MAEDPLPRGKFDPPPFGNIEDTPSEFLLYPKKILIQVLKEAFSEDTLFTDEEGKGFKNPYLYIPRTGDVTGGSPDDDDSIDEDSRLLIANEWNTELEEPDFRPALVISRSDFSFVEHGIGRGRNETLSGEALFDTQTFNDQGVTSLAVSCIERDTAPAERLAALVAIFLRMFHRTIRENSSIFRFGSPRIGVITPLKRDAKFDRVAVQVMVDVTQNFSFKLTNLDQKFHDRICVHIGSNFGL